MKEKKISLAFCFIINIKSSEHNFVFPRTENVIHVYLINIVSSLITISANSFYVRCIFKIDIRSE